MDEGPEEDFELDVPLLSVPVPDEDVVVVERGDDSAGKPSPSYVKQIETAWRVINSGVLVPDSMKGNPYIRSTAIAGAVLFLILPIKLYLVLLLVGLVAGIMLNPSWDRESPAFTRLKARFDAIDRAPIVLDGSSILAPLNKLSLTPRIDAALDVLLERLVASLIDPWYMSQNKSGQRDFQSCIRTTLDAALLSLRSTLGGLGKDSMTLYIYGLTNALNVHMQEYKAFCRSGVDGGRDFLLSARSLRAFCPTVHAELAHFRQIVTIVLKKLLPRQEAQSIVVVSLLKELLAAGVFHNAMDRLCDPDFINLKIVEALREPGDLAEKLEPGWSMVVLKVIKGKGLPVEGSESGFYCLVHIAGRRVRTHKVSSTGSTIWNETFQFRVSDAVLCHMKLHVQLLRYSYMGKDTSYGFAKVQPEVVSDPSGAKQHWLRFKTGEVFIETFVLSGSGPGVGVPPSSASPQLNESATSLPRLGIDPRLLEDNATIDTVLQDNELFMEFYEFLNEFRAPPYLQFFMNYDAFRQFTAMELGVDPSVPQAVENYFRSGPLKPAQVEQLKMIKADALDLFQTHFAGDRSKHPISVSDGLLDDLLAGLTVSDRVDEAGRYAGSSAVGPNLFMPVHRWIYEALRDVYYDKFKASERFRSCLEHSQHFSTSQQYVFADDEGRVDSELGDRSELGLDSESAEPDKDRDIQKISTAVSVLKQQLASIEDRVERGASPDLEKLLKTKRDLERQVKSLVDLVRSIESGQEGQEGDGDLWLDLRDVVIGVVPAENQAVFDVRVIRAGMGEEDGTLSVVSKAFADFETLHRALKKAFPKLAKVPLPAQSDPDLAGGLERYLQLLASDEFVRQSPVLRQFVSLDGDLEDRTLAASAGHLVEAVVGKRVKSVLTSVLVGGMTGGSPKLKKNHFYETREHHTTSELYDSTNSLSTTAGLYRSRSINSLIKNEEPSLVKKEVAPPKSVPPTPVKAARLESTADSRPSRLAVDGPQIFSVEEFTDPEIDMLMETVYAFITETFDLREPNQWIRRKVLSVSKQLLRQAYGDTLSKSMTASMNAGLRETPILAYIEALTRLLWPNEVFIKDVPPPNRSPDQQLATQIEARSLFINKNPDGIEKIAGRFNSINGMTRIFNLLQQKDFNKLIFMTAIDITTKILFTEQARP